MPTKNKALGAIAGMVSILLLSAGIAVGGGESAKAAAAGGEPDVEMLAVRRVGNVFPPGTSPSAICLFVNQVEQRPGAVIVHRHQAGAVYSVAGDVELTVWQNGLAPTDPGAVSTTATLPPGGGAVIPTHWWHQHANPGATTNTWWFLSAFDGPICSSPPASFRFVGPTVAFRDGPSLLKLFTITFAPGDETAQAGPGMIETLVVSGQVEVGGTSYTAGQGFYHSPGSVLHVSSATGAKLLSYSMVALGGEG
jgi:hypothetical protein